MLDTLGHGVTLTVTTTLVLVVAIPLSPAAVDVIDPLHHTVTQMTKLDCGVQHLPVSANIIVITGYAGNSHAYCLLQLCSSTNYMHICNAACRNNKAVRLVGGLSSNEGILEYCYNGAWTQICYSNFHIEEAVAACRQLGFNNPSKNI